MVTFGKKGAEMQVEHTRVSGVADKVLFLGLGGRYKHVFVMTICFVQFSNLCFIFSVKG